MSSGSLEYAYGKVDEIAGMVRARAGKPLHVAFAGHLDKVVVALLNLEWVLSGGKGPGEEDDAIRAVIGPGVELAAATDAARKAAADLADVLARVEPTS